MLRVLRIFFQALIRPVVRAVGAPLGGNEVEHLERRLLVGKVTSMPHCLAEPGVERLDGVGRLHEAMKLDGELEKRHELRPGSLPGVDHGRVTLPPGLREFAEAGLRDGHRGAV
jgi:hypothetical protein